MQISQFSRSFFALCWVVISASVLAQAPKPQYQPTVGQEGKDVVWVPTPQTVVDKMLDLAKVTSEDFVNGGLYNSTHNAPSRRYRDYMAFMHDFVISFGRQCIDLVHKYQKLAYVFYDDHWVGVEPSSPFEP